MSNKEDAQNETAGSRTAPAATFCYKWSRMKIKCRIVEIVEAFPGRLYMDRAVGYDRISLILHMCICIASYDLIL